MFFDTASAYARKMWEHRMYTTPEAMLQQRKAAAQHPILTTARQWNGEIQQLAVLAAGLNWFNGQAEAWLGLGVAESATQFSASMLLSLAFLTHDVFLNAAEEIMAATAHAPSNENDQLSRKETPTEHETAKLD